VIHEFPDGDALAAALAAHIAAAIAARLQWNSKAAIALSGGATPVKFLQALSEQPLNWSAVTVTLVDDRWVPPSSPRSNAGLVRAHLLQGPAAAAHLLSLVNDAATPEAGRAATEHAIRALPLPFAAVTLGMGTDGHTASFFPGGDHLALALNPEPGRLVETIRAEAASEPRITLTLPPLAAGDSVVIHIEGAEKREVLATAMQAGPVEAMPIRAVLARQPPPAVFWAPGAK
jgi:6-phosphogluconolactonase